MVTTKTLKAEDVVKRCNDLKAFWLERNKKFKEWYSLVEMEDKLKQDKMESFVGNDPRASFNLILSLLEQRIPHRIASADLTTDLAAAAGDVEEFFEVAWADIFEQYRRRGRYWLHDFLGLMLSTGWYNVFATITMDGTRCIAEIWHPSQVFQNWDDDLVECAHAFPATPMEARRLILRLGWNVEPPRQKVTVSDYWFLDDGGRVHNTIALGKDLVKPDTVEMRFKRIPIFTAPVGGLPDIGLMGPVGEANRWKAEMGQSLLATNENIYNSWNKWWTFSMQVMRDTAQPRTFERSRSGKPIIKAEDLFKRGAIFRGTPEDSIDFLVPPPIPIELRASQLDMEAMMQRGGPSWAMYGNIQQQMTAYVMSQVAASANQIAKPFHQGAIFALSDIDNFWLQMIRDLGYKPYNWEIPKELPENVKVTADYEIRIPGDLVQRATTARMLDPEFTLSPMRVMEELFPEIKNPLKELAQIRAARAERHPITVVIATIVAFREEAEKLRKARDTVSSQLYSNAANLLESQLSSPRPGPPSGGGPGPGPQTVPPPGTERMIGGEGA